MKKLILPTLLIFTIIFAGCGNEKISSSEIFEKNLKCQEYLSGFIENITPTMGGIIRSAGVFYSPRENSCIGYYEYADTWRSSEPVEHITRQYDVYAIKGLLGNSKKSTYTMNWNWNTDNTQIERTCIKKSDFKGVEGDYSCDYSNSKGEELRKKEIEWLKKN